MGWGEGGEGGEGVGEGREGREDALMGGDVYINLVVSGCGGKRLCLFFGEVGV